MNLLALTSDSASDSLFRLFIVAGLGFLAVNLVFRRLSGGVLPAVRGATALVVAAAIYFGGLQTVLRSSAPSSSLDFPSSLQDVKDPEKLLSLLREQHGSLVRSIEVQSAVAENLFFVSVFVGVSSLAFLWRMRAAQREIDYFKKQGHRAHEGQSEVP